MQEYCCIGVLMNNLFVIDNWYSNFDEIRAKALAAEYEERQGVRPVAEVWPGHHSKHRYVAHDKLNEFARIVGKKLYWHDTGTSQLFRYSPLKETKWHTKVHIDPTDWVGVVYLNTPEQARAHEDCGTNFYRHKETNTEYVTGSFNDYYQYITRDGWKMDRWDELIRVPMKSNRMVIFNGRHWHSHGGNFGTTVEDSRLIHLYLLNEAPVLPGMSEEGAHFYG